MLKKNTKFIKKKSLYYWKKYKKNTNLRNNVKEQRGRPTKLSNNSIKTYQIQDILSNPSLIQTFELFSDISKALLSYTQEESIAKTEKLKRYNYWLSNSVSTNLSKEDCIIPFYSDDLLKQKFYELLTLVINQTKDSLSLSKEGGEILINIVNSFCDLIDFEPNETINNTIWIIYQNNTMKACFNKLFDRIFFNELITNFIKWKNFFGESFNEDSKKK